MLFLEAKLCKAPSGRAKLDLHAANMHAFLGRPSDQLTRPAIVSLFAYGELVVRLLDALFVCVACHLSLSSPQLSYAA
jgi:hypothetical protein